MVTARSSRSVSQPRLDLNHLNSPFLCLFHQSVAGSNYLAASVAWWSPVFHFFSCSDRHHCSTQGLFCFHWNRSVLLPLLSLTSMGLQAGLFACLQRSTTKNENQSKCANNCLKIAYLSPISIAQNDVNDAEFFSPKNLKNMNFPQWWWVPIKCNVHRFLLFSSQPLKCQSFAHCSPLSLCPGISQDLAFLCFLN